MEGQLDGKFMAVSPESLRFPSLSSHSGICPVALFRRDPEVQDQRDQADAADPGKPEAQKPEEALAKRALRSGLRHQ
jgi:hypothetical protein